MTRKLLVRQGGGTATEVDFLDIGTPRKGSPWFDRDTPLFQVGQRFANGEAAMGYFKIVDPAAALSTTGFRTRPWAEVRLTEDASGDELTIGWMRITANDASRRTPYTGGDQVEHDPQLMDCNMDLRGIPWQDGWDRPAETDQERLEALEAAKLNGASSTAPKHRVTTDITIAGVSSGHLCDFSSDTDLDANMYPAGTEVAEIIADIATQSGKIFGVVLHHTGGTTHKCLLYIDQDDLSTYTTDVRISDQLADFAPDDPDAPTFEPHWLMGAGREQNMEGVISGLISIYGGLDDNPRTVYVETGDDDDEWETWIGVYHDDLAKQHLAQATRRANWILADRRLPYQTHKVSILVNADQVHLVEAGMAIETKSVVMEPGPNKHAWIWRRVAEKTVEPAPDGRYWLHLHLERPHHSHGPSGGATQPGSTSPEPAPEHEPDPGDSLEKFYNADADPGGDAENWSGLLGNQGNVGDGIGANGSDGYYYKSNSPRQYQRTWAYAAGDQLRVTGYLGCRSSTGGGMMLAFTALAPGSEVVSTLATHVLATNPLQHSHGNEWTLFSAGPFTAPVGTTSVALGIIGGKTADFDEVSIYTVVDAAANDVDAVDYDGFPHESTHWLPSDYVEARLDDLEVQIGDVTGELAAGIVTLQKVQTNQRFPVWGHRGDIGSADSLPENTLESVLQCALKGIQGAEVDVRLSSEGTFYLMHDATVDRTTSGTGAIASKNDAAIDALTVNAGYGYISGSYSVPTLESVFDALNPYDFVLSVQLNVSSDANAAALAQFILDQGWAHRCLIEVSTLSEAAVIKALSGALTVQVNNTISGADADDNVDWLSMERATVTSLAVVTGKAPQHVKSYITINDFPADETSIIQNMWDRGVAAYQTDNVDFALAARNALVYGSAEATADAHIADTSDAHDASAVSVLDTGSNYTATDVEAALAEIADRVDALPTTSGAVDHQHIDSITYSGDGATTSFELPASPFDEFSVQAFVSGTRTEVTLSGTLLTTMTFGAAPASATDNIKVDLVAAVV